MVRSVLVPLCVVLLAFVSTGCVTTHGSRTVVPTRFDYSEALARSWNEQILLNLVRLRYRDAPQFLQVSSIVTQFSYSAGASAGGSPLVDDAGDTLGLSGNVGYSERPTISYEPLQGSDFARRFLSPFSPETLVLMSQSGWSIERLMLCCVHQINDLRNAPSAAGPTPDYVPPQWKEFHQAAELLRRLQVAGTIQAAARVDDGRGGLVLRIDDEFAAQRGGLTELLGIRSDRGEYRLSGRTLNRSPDEIALVGRSLLGTLFFLSQAVEPPDAHVEAGWVTVTRDAEGRPWDWSELTGKLLRVRSQEQAPRDAYVRVRYRGYWYWIADADLNSKTTFGLLSHLFALQSEPGGRSPLLTISAGE